MTGDGVPGQAQYFDLPPGRREGRDHRGQPVGTRVLAVVGTPADHQTHRDGLRTVRTHRPQILQLHIRRLGGIDISLVEQGAQLGGTHLAPVPSAWPCTRPAKSICSRRGRSNPCSVASR